MSSSVTASSSYINYTFNPAIFCEQTIEPYVNISFKNVIGQIKSAQLNIPVIYGKDSLNCLLF